MLDADRDLMSLHESVTPRDKVESGSPRSFGLVFGGFFVVVGLLGWYRAGAPRVWPFALAAAFVVVALVAPRLLAPLNRLWFRFGLALHGVTTPVIMGLVYFGALVPLALVMRALGKRPLQLGRDADAPTYWIARDPPGPARGSMAKQF
jgi:hypothetical protein